MEINDLSEGLLTAEQEFNKKQLINAAKSFPDKDNDPVYTPNPAQEWDVDVTAKSQIWKK